MHSSAPGSVLAGPAVGAARFQYHRARSANEVDDLMAELGPDARIIAGGTDLIVQVRAGFRKPAHVIDIADIAELSGISLQDNMLRVGSVASLSAIQEFPRVPERFAALVEGCRNVGSIQIQSRATLAGNACNGSPAADTSPALLLYDTTVGIRSVGGRRELPVVDFWTGPGRTALRPGEWVEYLTLADPGIHGSSYVKLGRTRGVDLALVGIACLVAEHTVRLACASMAPATRRMAAVEDLLNANPAATTAAVDSVIASELTPISDIRASARYRLAMAGVCTRKAFALATDRRKAASS
jgi:CO/xanthine dehydrogenase FAD-binding subunit